MFNKLLFMIVCLISFLIILPGCMQESEQSKGNTNANEEVDNSEVLNTSKNIDSNSDFKVTLLGTGAPNVSTERFSNSTLVEVAGQKLLFDVGRGSTIRLAQMGLTPGMIDKLFITHLHHDHILDFDDLLITGTFIPGPEGISREGKLKVWGPEGTENWITHIIESYRADIGIRENVDGISIDIKPDIDEIVEGVVYENEGVEVIAFEVDHGPMEPAFGFRINYKGYSVVISGDTTYSENLIEYAKGTDLLIQEVVVVRTGTEEEYKAEAHKNIEAYHTTPEQAGEMFKKIQPKLAAYTHLSLLVPEKEARIKERTEAIYDGEVVVGEDLMSFEIGEEINIIQPK